MDRDEASKILGKDIIESMRAEAAAVGVELKDDLEAVAIYAAGRADHLSLIVGDPGFEEALIAERDNVSLMASRAAVHRADAIDARVLAVARGGLALAARGLRIMAGAPTV